MIVFCLDQTKLQLDMSNSNSMILFSARLIVKIRPNFSLICQTPIYVVAARVGGIVMSPNMTVWYRGARLVHLSPTGWSGVWQSQCWNSRNSRIQQFLKPSDQLHRFWFENLSDINPLAKILNPSQNLSFLILWSYYWLRPCYGSYHWALSNPFLFVSHDISYFG